MAKNQPHSINPALMKGLKRKLGSVTSGAYFKAYRDSKGNLLSSNLELAVAKILEFSGAEYEYRKKVKAADTSITVDFVTKRGFIQVYEDSTSLSKEEAEKIRLLQKAHKNKQTLIVARTNMQPNLESLGVPVAALASESLETRTQSLFVDDPSLSFDYSHILPWSNKCSVLHGHTSTMLIEVIGRPVNGMIVDFGEVKQIVKECVRALDHKLFIAQKYVKEDKDSSYRIRFKGPNGAFDLTVPKQSTFPLEGEATVENLAEVVVKMVSPKMPSNVEALGVYIYEGLNKGSHLLANLKHADSSKR
ncbi:MAG: 6-carboxytetrahydropterin synthase [Thaumarchaeota archaeon]|nr:6-carboxytetrahydropterin synthase [Nitrososphaerota archaeon]